MFIIQLAHCLDSCDPAVHTTGIALRNRFILLLISVAAIALVAACSSNPEPTSTPEPTPSPTSTVPAGPVFISTHTLNVLAERDAFATVENETLSLDVVVGTLFEDTAITISPLIISRVVDAPVERDSIGVAFKIGPEDLVLKSSLDIRLALDDEQLGGEFAENSPPQVSLVLARESGEAFQLDISAVELREDGRWSISTALPQFGTLYQVKATASVS